MPVVGNALFGLLDGLLHIPPFYPLRDLSHPSPNNLVVDHLIRQGLGRSLLARVRTEPLPFISTFYAPTLVADRGHEGDVYSVICDADLNRVWVASEARRSRIRYFARCGRAMRRLRQYGVPDDRILITGFTLPRVNIGGPGMDTLKPDLLALAEKAFSGFIKNRKLGVYKIEEVLETGTMARETHPLRR